MVPSCRSLWAEGCTLLRRDLELHDASWKQLLLITVKTPGRLSALAGENFPVTLERTSLLLFCLRIH
jgi:hypothetical protein